MSRSPIQPSQRPSIARSFTTWPTPHASQCAVSTRTEAAHPPQVTFRLAASYGIHSALEAHDWFLGMMRVHEEFEVETDKAGELPVPFCSETVLGVMVE